MRCIATSAAQRHTSGVATKGHMPPNHYPSG